MKLGRSSSEDGPLGQKNTQSIGNSKGEPRHPLPMCLAKLFDEEIRGSGRVTKPDFASRDMMRDQSSLINGELLTKTSKVMLTYQNHLTMMDTSVERSASQSVNNILAGHADKQASPSQLHHKSEPNDIVRDIKAAVPKSHRATVDVPPQRTIADGTPPKHVHFATRDEFRPLTFHQEDMLSLSKKGTLRSDLLWLGGSQYPTLLSALRRNHGPNMRVGEDTIAAPACNGPDSASLSQPVSIGRMEPNGFMKDESPVMDIILPIRLPPDSSSPPTLSLTAPSKTSSAGGGQSSFLTSAIRPLIANEPSDPNTAKRTTPQLTNEMTRAVNGRHRARSSRSKNNDSFSNIPSHDTYLHHLSIGDVGAPSDMCSTQEEANFSEIDRLQVHDFAFVLRSADKTWTYAIIADRDEDSILFVMDTTGSIKLLLRKNWSACVRLVNNTHQLKLKRTTSLPTEVEININQIFRRTSTLPAPTRYASIPSPVISFHSGDSRDQVPASMSDFPPLPFGPSSGRSLRQVDFAPTRRDDNVQVIQSALGKIVGNMPFTDAIGITGRYTGRVNELMMPHGRGTLIYLDRTAKTSVWNDGVPIEDWTPPSLEELAARRS